MLSDQGTPSALGPPRSLVPFSSLSIGTRPAVGKVDKGWKGPARIGGPGTRMSQSDIKGCDRLVRTFVLYGSPELAKITLERVENTHRKEDL